MTLHPVMLLPYLLVGMLIAMGLERASFLKWTWEPPPAHVRILVGFLWPLWFAIILIYAALGKVNK